MLQKQHTLDKRNSAKIKVKEPQHVLEMNRPQRNQGFSIPGFPGRVLAKSRDPGIFRDGISLKFSSQDLSGLPSQVINLINFIHFG